MAETDKTKNNAGVPSVDEIFNEDDYMLEDDYLETSEPSSLVKEAAQTVPVQETAAAPAPVKTAPAPVQDATAPVSVSIASAAGESLRTEVSV